MNIDLNSLAEGAVAEKLDVEFQKLLKNMVDPNTDPTKSRSITLTLTFKGNKKRELWDCAVKAVSKLAPSKDVDSTFIVARGENGVVVGRELSSGVPGQMYIDREGDVATDIGEKIPVEEQQTTNSTPTEKHVVDFRKQKTN
ncbi:replication terminator protein [Bacillus thuringiensis]|uniref:replication terminator protein n=1 Tax=Bacillus thuringiensis TaxID=1428 RepID=UPI000BFD6B85|nr:replication terminator protein [Bacillus thuringiensis]PGO44761.1 replication terminator protein [Bacillus thuringiensis]